MNVPGNSIAKSNAIVQLNENVIAGCILGTAIGDATGLKREGLSRDRAIWLHGKSPSPDLIFGRGFCSDDTEHTVLAGVAYLRSEGDVQLFKKIFAGLLRKWLMTLPAGIGLGTLQAIIKSLFVGADRSGVSSAGNGPAMRAAIIGLLANDMEQLEELNKVSTRITHSDPRAEEGALVIAKAARFAAISDARTPLDFIEEIIPNLAGDELRSHFVAMPEVLKHNTSPREFAASRGWAKGPAGYVNQTVPMAIYCWAHTPNNFHAIVTNAVLLGGDTDSVGAIAGSIAGSGCGYDSIPTTWLNQLAEWPRDVKWMNNLAENLACMKKGSHTKAPSLRWGRTLVRNILFGITVLLLYFRRFVPIRHRSVGEEQ